MSASRLSILPLPTRRTGNQMKSFLRSEVFQQTIQSSAISCSIGQKLNQTGVFYNERFLWLLEGDSINYGKIPDDSDVIPFKNVKDLPIKTRILMESVYEFEVGKKQGDRWIKIKAKGQKGKGDIVWEFKMQTRAMCLKWKSKLEDSKEKNNRIHSNKVLPGQSIIKKEDEFDFSLYLPRDSKEQDLDKQKEMQAEKQKQEIEKQRIRQMQKQQEQKQRQKQKQAETEKQKQLERQKQLQKDKYKIKSQKLKNLTIDTSKPSSQINIHSQKLQTPNKKGKMVEFSPETSSPTFKKKQKQNPAHTQIFILKEQIQLFKQHSDKILDEYKHYDWQQKFIQEEDTPKIIVEFNEYCEIIAIKLIDELLLPELERTYQPIIISQYSMEYRIGQFYVKLCWPISPEQRQRSKEKQKDKQRIDPYEFCIRQLKFFEHILSKTKNKCFLKVPLTTIISYKGLNIFFKVKPECSQSLIINQQYLLDCITQFSQITNIPIQTLMQKQSSIFPCSDQKTLVLEDSLSILPLDPHNYIYPIYPYIYKMFVEQKFKMKKQSQISSSSQSNMQLSRSKINTSSVDSKVEELFNISLTYDYVINQVVEYLEESIQKLVSLPDFFSIFSNYGLSNYDLAKLFKLSNLQFIRSFIFTTIVAVSFMKIFRHKISLEIKNLSMKKTMKYIQKQSYLLNFSINLLNKTLFGSKSNEQIWKSIFSVTKNQFDIQAQSLIYKEFNQNIFKQGVFEYVSGIKYSIDFTADFNSILSRKQVSKFKSKIISADVAWTPYYSSIKSMIRNQSLGQSAFQNIVQIFDLKQKSRLPRHLSYCSFKDEIISFLANYISSLSKQYKLNLYRQTKSLPNWIDYHLMKINYIWLMKERKEHQARNIKYKFVELLAVWNRPNHPLYLDFLKIQQKLLFVVNPSEALLSGKDLLIKALELLDVIGNIKLSEYYNQLAENFMLLGRFSEALSHFNSCKSLIQNKSPKTYQYYQLVLNIAKLNLHQNNPKQCFQNLSQCIPFYQFKSKYQDQLIQCCQLLYRCNLITKSNPHIYKICESMLTSPKSSQNYTKLLKITTQPTVTKIKYQIREQLVRYWRLQMKEKDFNGDKRCKQGLAYIQKVVNENQFFDVLNYIRENGDEVFQKMFEIRRLSKWKEILEEKDGVEDQCLALMQAMYYFLGEGFILQ